MTKDLFSFSSTNTEQIAPENLPKFPTTRYQGSKRKLLMPLAAAFSELNFDTALDLFSGSGSISLLLRYLGKKTDANDYLLFNKNIAELFLSATLSQVRSLNPAADLKNLLHDRDSLHQSLVEIHYDNIFFTREENRQIDQFCQNIEKVDNFRRLVYIYAVGQALMKKRPYNLFHRANLGMRLKDVKRSFGNAVTWEQSIEHHAIKAVQELMQFNFPEVSNHGTAHSINTINLSKLPNNYDLVYVDPPYLNNKGQETNYSGFYGFLNGLCNYSLFGLGDINYSHKPITISDSGWRTESDALLQVENITRRWPDALIFLSYRSDGKPTSSALCEALSIGGRQAKLHSFGEFKYALSKNDTNEELFILSHP